MIHEDIHNDLDTSQDAKTSLGDVGASQLCLLACKPRYIYQILIRCYKLAIVGLQIIARLVYKPHDLLS